MDVGCGTGILSMFCAKAGAKRVWAVDNSEIVEKARGILKMNGLDGVVKVIKGMVEEIKLPVDEDGGVGNGNGNSTTTNTASAVLNSSQAERKEDQKVDIIISEWMGYALLYEAMLPSVLTARDKYLSPSGTLAPSHTTIRLAPMNDQELINDTIDFWNDVYGFDMRIMSERGYDNALVRNVEKEKLIGESVEVERFDLNRMSVGECDFRKPFCVILQNEVYVKKVARKTTAGNSGDEKEKEKEKVGEREEIHLDGLTGFLLWFDTFFLTSPDTSLPDNIEATEDLAKTNLDGIAFTTGPFGKSTHWGAGHLPIIRASSENSRGVQLNEGDHIKGLIEFGQHPGSPRDVEIAVRWDVDGKESGKQTWTAGGSFDNPPSTLRL